MSSPFFEPQPYSNPEVAAWVARVIAAGSSVSRISASAHDVFVTAMKAAGTWTSILRMNTYGAATFAGIFVPLVNTVGNTTETNHNFISTDWSLSVGLTGDGSTKYLDTGAAASSLWPSSLPNIHAMACVASEDTVAFANYLGMNVSSARILLGNNGAGNSLAFNYLNGTVVATGAATLEEGFLVGTSVSGTPIQYRNAVVPPGESTTIGSGTFGSTTLFVHGANTGTGTPVFLTKAVIQGYSLGATLTSTQVTSYYNAFKTLMIALGRTIPT